MKKGFLIITIICLLFVTGCNNKKETKKPNEEQKSVLKNIKDIISYTIPDTYEYSDSLYLEDETETIVEENYAAKENDGYLQISIFSYKNRDLFSDETIDENEYIRTLAKREEISIDNKLFSIGYASGDDYEEFNGKALVRTGDYVIEFTMSNFDNPITEEQFNDLKEIIKTVKFK